MQIAVLGLGSFGYKIATTLTSLGSEVLAVDINPAIVEDIKDRVAQAVCADCTDEKAIRAIGVPDVDAAVVAIGENMEMSIMTTVLLREIGVSKIIARATSNTHEKVLKEVGASRVVRIEEQMGEQIAKGLVAPHVLEHIPFAAGYSLVEIKAPREFIGRSLLDLQIRKTYEVNVIAIQKKVPSIDEHGRSFFKTVINMNPGPDDKMTEDDVIVLVGSHAAVERILKL